MVQNQNTCVIYVQKVLNYIPLRKSSDGDVIPTSNRVERMFSRCKLVMNDLRASMHPRTLENFMMLRENKHLWGQHTVEEALSRKDIQWPDEMDDEDEDDSIPPALINVTLDSDNE
jgi:hypothetical protein